jgi:DNA-binding NarL/FixJ family response regulator
VKNNNIKIIITDDSEKYRKVLHDILEPYECDLIAQAENGKILLDLLQTKEVDVILLDLEMPVMDGNTAFKIIREKYPHAKVIILSLHHEDILIENYMNRGAKGYIPKDGIMGEPHLLINAIRKVYAGDTFIYGDSFKKEKYTKRQMEIMPLIFDGLTNKEIAGQMGISKRAVEQHRSAIYERSGAKTPMEFYKHAFSKGLQFLSRLQKRKK